MHDPAYMYSSIQMPRLDRVPSVAHRAMAQVMSATVTDSSWNAGSGPDTGYTPGLGGAHFAPVSAGACSLHITSILSYKPSVSSI